MITASTSRPGTRIHPSKRPDLPFTESRPPNDFGTLKGVARQAGVHRLATQQAFLEEHKLAFACFGSVFRRLRYDVRLSFACGTLG
jgi:hypothetical protein